MSRGLDNFRHKNVYRALRPDESPHRDIVCKDRRSRRSISEHVEDGLKYPSRFISTSASICKAMKWISTSNCRTPSEYSNLKPRDTIVEIDIQLLKLDYPSIANSAYDFTNYSVRSNFLETDKQEGYADGYREVVFDTRIPSDVVNGIYVMGKGWIWKKAGMEEQASSTPEPVLNNSTTVTADIPSLAVTTPNNDSSTVTADIPSLAVTTPNNDSSIVTADIPSLSVTTPNNDSSTVTADIPSLAVTTPNNNSSTVTADIPSLAVTTPNNDSSTVTADIPSLAVTTPNNNSATYPTPFELTLSTQSQSSTVDSIQVDTITRVKETARFKRKLTYEDVEPPLKYTCEEAQVQPLPMLTRARARIEEMKRNLFLFPIKQIRRSNRNISKPTYLNNYILS